MRARTLFNGVLILSMLFLVAMGATGCDDEGMALPDGDGSDGDLTDGDAPGKCNFDSQCDPGFVCCLDSCVLPADCHCTADDECILDQDCSSDKYCNGSCVCDIPPDGDVDGDEPTPCDAENPCPDGFECKGGKCERTTDGPLIVLIPAAVNFGVVQIGEEACRNLGVRNEGTEPLDLYSMEFTQPTSPNYYWTDSDGEKIPFPLGGSNVTLTLGVGEQAIYRICVKPDRPGRDVGQVQIICNIRSNPTRLVDLTTEYKGVTTLEVANPASLTFDFGSVEIGDTKTVQVTLNNLNTDPTHNKILSIGPIQFDPELQGDFSVPATLLPNEIKYMAQGDSLTFPVYFRPMAEGRKNVKLTIFHDADYFADGGAPPRPLEIILDGVGVVPCLEVDPNPINFGQVTVGGTVSKTVALKSVCGGTIRMEDIQWGTLLSPDFEIVDRGDCAHAVIPPGERCTFRVNYTPSEAGNDAAILLLTSNNASAQTTQVSVMGQGVQSVIDVSPTTCDFGEVLVGSTATCTVRITNNGAGELLLSNDVFDQSLVFDLNPFDRDKLPVSLANGASEEFRVLYRPTNTTPGYGGDHGTWTITTNNPTYQYIQVPLSGTPVWPYCTFSVVQLPNFIDTIDFGEVNLDSTKTMTLRISNTGKWPCEIHSITRCQNTSGEFTYSPEIVPPIQYNSNTNISVSYSPQNWAGPDDGCITLTTNDARSSHASFTVNLAGFGVNPSIIIEPVATLSVPHNFGDILKNSCSSWSTFRVMNFGVGTLIVSSYQLGGYMPGAWTLGTWNYPMNGLPNGHLRNHDTTGDEITFSLRFCPLGLANVIQKAEITLLSNDSARSSRIVHAVGRGVDCPPGTYNLDDNPNDCEYTCPTPQADLWPIEKCDGWDNDCNGITDEGFNVGETCTGLGVCGVGVWECGAGLTYAARCSTMPGGSHNQSSHEICNGLDDDCDGLTDEDFPVRQACVGVGACGVGSFECATNYTVRCSTDIGGSLYGGTPEKCNRTDDNCDGFVDNGVFLKLNTGDPPQSCNNCVGDTCGGTGTCGWGVWECALETQYAGTMVRCCSDPGGSCQGSMIPERCDGLDNDCDGTPDNGFNIGAPCVGVGQCGAGITQCDPADTQKLRTICSTDIGGDDYPWMREECNGLDDDCDGLTDEDFDVGVTCYGVGACSAFPGQIECNPNAGGPGQPTTVCSTGKGGSNYMGSSETCNGIDDNCDGVIDNGFNIGAPCIGTGDCGVGVLECSGLYATRCSSNPGGSNSQATTEVCDGRDNDCDGLTDENIVGNLSVGSPCEGIGECGPGVYVCKGLTNLGCSTEPGGPNNQAMPETCDGKDNNCNGLTDEDFLVGQSCQGAGECGMGVWECATTTTRRCSTNPGGSSYQGMPEICDNKDNDCDGTIDNGFDLCNGVDSINNCGACNNVCRMIAGQGTVECRTYAGGGCGCEIASCTPPYHNTDGLYATGCECSNDSWDLSGTGNSCATAVSGGAEWTLTDNNALPPKLVHGNLAALNDEDWFVFDAIDGPESPPHGDKFNFQVSVTAVSSEVVVDVYRGNCSTQVCNGKRNFAHRTDSAWYGQGADPLYTGQNPCVPTSWYGCPPSAPSKSTSYGCCDTAGVIQGGTTPTGMPANACTTQYNWCEQRNLKFYVRVYRVLSGGQTPTCGNYTLSVSNGYSSAK